jgi:hypothetical protein
MNTNIAGQLEEKEDARNKALESYSNASKNMVKRIERDQALLLEEDSPSTVNK